MVTDYGVLFRELAVPRPVGTPNHQRVREALKRELSTRAFAVEEHPFAGRPARALFGVPKSVQGINLIAQRAPSRLGTGGGPSVWLVAHYDSKGQPISMAVRLLGVFAAVAGILGLPLAPLPAAALLVIGLVVVAQNRVNDNSPGAVDNASALVAVFMAIDQVPPEKDVGIIFPDAEEFGLVGARALIADRAELFAEAAVINLDGLDDAGRPVALLHKPGPLGEAIAVALGARRARRLPVIVDGIPLARVAAECVTILKGNWRTMRIVHRPGDTVARVRLDGAANVAAGLARVLRGL
ncbi:MAG: M28 family peptidase [Gemmatimonadales bacterium]